MGRYADSLEHRIRARRIAPSVSHPRGYRGMVMHCSLCRAEVLRSDNGKVPLDKQQAALDEHMRVCELRGTDVAARARRLQRLGRRIQRRPRLRKAATVFLAVMAAVVVAIVIAKCMPR